MFGIASDEIFCCACAKKAKEDARYPNVCNKDSFIVEKEISNSISDQIEFLSPVISNG